MIVKMFKPRFAPLVENGMKKTTIRPVPKRDQDMPKEGQDISLRTWTGLPYRSKHRVLKESQVEVVCPVEVRSGGVAMKESDFNRMDAPSHEAIAKGEGFKDFEDMRQWFLDEHGSLPFPGILIRWK